SIRTFFFFFFFLAVVFLVDFSGNYDDYLRSKGIES
ncbi:hypothetical protein K800_19027, partial [Salmonella enterica subsp. enterica serovar Newport str. SHSN010]